MRRPRTKSRRPAKTQHGSTTKPKRKRAPTAARRASSTLADLQDQVSALTRGLAEAREQQTATAEILGIISGSPTDVQSVFDTIVRNFVSLCGGIFGAIYTFDGQLVHFAGAYGLTSEQVNALRAKYPVTVNDRSVLSSRAILAKAPMHIQDTISDLYYDREHAAIFSSRRLLAVPMLRKGVPLGTIVAGWAKPGAIPKQHEDLLKVFAAQAVIAIENARLLNELRESLQQQTATAEVLNVISRSPRNLQPVFDSIVATAAELCKADFAMIHRWEHGKFHLVAANKVETEYVKWLAQHPPASDNGSISGRVVAAGATIHIPDILTDSEYARTRSESLRRGQQRTTLGVPLMREGAAIGVIALHRTEVRPFTNKQIELVNTFADQAVIAIENARLFEAEQQRTRELSEALEQQTATSKVLEVISSSPGELDSTFNAMLENAARICEARNATIFLRDGDVAVTRAQFGSFGGSPIGYRTPLGLDWLTGRAILEARTINVPDLLNSDFPVGRERASRYGNRATLAVPLLREGIAIGAIVVHRPEARTFTTKQAALVTNFAAQAVIAIENARLLNELRESYRVVQQQTGKLEVQSQELAKLNQQLEQRVADQVGEIERMSRLRRFLPPQVADLIIASGTERQLESHRREITALYCDLRGFTGFSEAADPEDVMALLREYHAAVGEIINRYSGTLERYAGDGVMVIFNDPVPVPKPALQAVQAAVDMRQAIGTLTEKWCRLGHDLGFGIGIAHGYATLGTIGFEGRFDYAAIGTVSNVASRLCDEAKPGQILISPRVLVALEDAASVESIGEFTLKGIRRPLPTYNVLAIKSVS